MRVGIIDADLLGRKRHRFPNLACMKISGFHKKQGNDVTLLMNYDEIVDYDKVYISKVFTDTPCPEEVLSYPHVEWGGQVSSSIKLNHYHMKSNTLFPTIISMITS